MAFLTGLKSIYSPLGLRRGLVACAFASALWLAWASAYLNGIGSAGGASGSHAPPIPDRPGIPFCACRTRV